MIARIWRRFDPRDSLDPATAALVAYESHPGRGAPLGALYGSRQVLNRDRRLVDGPACLVVLTADRITLCAAATGEIVDERSLIDFDGYLMDAHGRFVVRFRAGHGQAHVGTFRPIAAPHSTLSTSKASAVFVRQVIAIWEVRTGLPFINSWTGRFTQVDD